MAERFATTLGIAHHTRQEPEYLWEAAARIAEINSDDVTLLSENGLAYLVGQDWVVSHDGKWNVRAWEGEDDEFYKEADELGALDERDL